MILKSFAKFISIVFHPLLVMTYMLLLLIMVNPYIIFGDQFLLFVNVFATSFLIPMVGILVMWGLNMISSLEMPDKDERIGAYIVTGVFYLWVTFNLYKNGSAPVALKVASLGATIGLFIAFIFNLFTKISLHALGMGGLLGFTLLTMLYFSYDSFYWNSSLFGSLEISMTFVFVSVLLLTGLVCTSRMILRAHNLQDLYAGFIVGLSTQFMAMMILF